jgi:hypothetical protein
MKYTCFDDLPKGMQTRVIALHPRDYVEWVSKEVPALDGKSLIDTLNQEDGYGRIMRYLGKIEGYLA